jgi:hypothetical protein
MRDSGAGVDVADAGEGVELSSSTLEWPELTLLFESVSMQSVSVLSL